MTPLAKTSITMASAFVLVVALSVVFPADAGRSTPSRDTGCGEHLFDYFSGDNRGRVWDRYLSMDAAMGRRPGFCVSFHESPIMNVDGEDSGLYITIIWHDGSGFKRR